MLSGIEKIVFLILVFFSVGLAYQGFRKMFQIIMAGQGELRLDNLPARLFKAGMVYITQQTTLKTRPLSSLFHLGIVWGFTFYFLVNFGDLLEGYIEDFKFLGTGFIADAYHLVGDLLSVAVLSGMTYFILRRFVLENKTDLKFHDNVLLHPRVKAGRVNIDSLIVGIFILSHVGARFLGESVKIELGIRDGDVMPFASVVAALWGALDLSSGTLEFMEHVFWWVALGGIVVFLPYFPYTKHAHLFMAPLNFLTRPNRTSLGEMAFLDMEDPEKEQFGVKNMEHLHKTAIFDAFACIMCNRCQDVCPAYTTGKELSPSALEINKRYMIRENMNAFATDGKLDLPLVGNAISESAVWACTACGACIEICPVGNEPMLDILEIRRDLVLVQSEFPAELQAAMNGMERQGNPWQVADSRVTWAKGLNVPTVEENPNFDILYWTGCAVAYDPRAQITARAFVKLLQKANVNFAILGDSETCTGDIARRAGNEFLYQEMAKANVETLNALNPKRIVATCPHCLHNLGKEYHQFGGNYTVIHHTELIEELITAGKLPANAHPKYQSNVTFHDPCYLGRHNGIYDAPRAVLNASVATFTELPRSKSNSFCCGAGGAQFWKEEEHGTKAVNVERYEEAKHTGAEVLAVGCPFCMQMFDTAKSEVTDGPIIKDIAELVLERLESPASAVKPVETAAH